MEGDGGGYGKGEEKHKAEDTHLGSGQLPKDVHLYCQDCLAILNLLGPTQQLSR